MALKKIKNDGDSGEIIITEKSNSSKFEGYNRLRDNILYLNADGNNKVIQVESSIKHEGKTSLLANLAVSLGYTDKKVIVVDLDFRDPKLHRKFKVEMGKGISEYMIGDISRDQLIRKTSYKNVDIICRGDKIYNSSLIFISEKFKELVADLREQYDFVLLDCAPVLQISDYINISRVSDGVLFVVAYATTTKNQVSDAIAELRKNGAKLLGSVFTMYDSKKAAGYGYGKYYGYGGYYSNYGYNKYEDNLDGKSKRRLLFGKKKKEANK